MNPVEKISRLFSTNRFRGSLGGTILAAIGLFPAIRDAFATGKSGLGVGYILLIPLAFYGLWKTIPADPHPIAEQTEFFKPFQELKPEDAWSSASTSN